MSAGGRFTPNAECVDKQVGESGKRAASPNECKARISGSPNIAVCQALRINLIASVACWQMAFSGSWYKKVFGRSPNRLARVCRTLRLQGPSTRRLLKLLSDQMTAEKRVAKFGLAQGVLARLDGHLWLRLETTFST
ncbi:unnamed protein product [Protopolystoma xenopodis]|uniref:Uncharacterized protein n=1 Tax=Protopolystoma xenopodis TaxID=117903 RepID=A0A448XH01_9PLAT|nr:unnamed protein product [Protopolystoma xenopodis]